MHYLSYSKCFTCCQFNFYDNQEIDIHSSESAWSSTLSFGSQYVMHTDNMMDERTDGPTHFSWSAL